MIAPGKVLDFNQHAEDLFTEVFYSVQDAQFSGKRFFVNFGGGGSSKSVSQHQNELLNLLDCKFDILFMRKVAATIYNSCYKLLESLAKDYGIYDRFKWTYSNDKREILNKKTGKRIIFSGADDIDKLKSIVGIGRIILEEADAFDFTDFKEINRRARGYENIQIVFILNPVDEEHWIKTNFVDSNGPYHARTFISHSTYHNNKFLTQEDREELEALKEIDENEYNIYALGKWGRLKTGSEYYPQFSEVKHTGHYPFVKAMPVFHLSYDFNVVPYMTLLAFQYLEDSDTIRIRLFKEYCLSSPLNTTTAVSESFVDDHEKWIQSIFYYGDASGNGRIAGKGDEVNFDDARLALQKYLDNSSDRVSPSNKPVLARRKLVMKLLAGKLYFGGRLVILEIDAECFNTIRDFKYMKLGPNGKLKEKVEKNGVKYEDFGHTTDAFEYFVCELFQDLM